MPHSLKSSERIGGFGRRGATVSAGPGFAGGASIPAPAMYSSIWRCIEAEATLAKRMFSSRSIGEGKLAASLDTCKPAEQYDALRAERLQADRMQRTEQRPRCNAPRRLYELLSRYIEQAGFNALLASISQGLPRASSFAALAGSVSAYTRSQ